MRLIWIFIFSLLITGCATIAPQTASPEKTSWQERSTRLSQLSQWKLNGKIAVQTAQDSGSATIDWSQKNQNFLISLLGPLGSGGLKLSGHPGSVTMQTADGKVASASTPEQLLIKQWGWNLPVSNLSYWVRGLPVPGIAANTQFDQFHRLTNLTQQGWNVQYLGYTTTSGVELPQRIVIASSSLKAKMMIYTWNISHLD